MFCSHVQFVAKSLRCPCTPRGSNVTPQHCKHAPIAVCAHASKHSTLHLRCMTATTSGSGILLGIIPGKQTGQ